VFAEALAEAGADVVCSDIDMVGLDLQGVFFCAREALEVMMRQKSGKIIKIASVWGLVGSSSIMPIPAYNTAKGAVVNLTRELGLESSFQNDASPTGRDGRVRGKDAGSAHSQRLVLR